ncbi:pyridoxamine phosphate oxidase [Aspergillus arachidicola]|uniref:Pyridoxamine phosphate oxidase n=1 Tax=Aspergillus arachidicola TaxID=656916 RepID=A0A2G7GAV2_9EURO|nr:pyridoxamine phosphate oxidase [Aspergillus arachidicola]
MTDSLNPPLSYEASATTTHPHVASTLPQEVIACLKNSRFLHLATCDGLTPHVSLMSYTYLPSTPYDQYPTIIMTTNPSSRKTNHLLTNPRVSLLVHDWVSHRPPTRAPNPGGQRDGSPPPAATRSSLANLLLNLNTSALSSISTTIAGSARVLEPGSEEEAWCKEQHLENNTFEEEMGLFGQQQQQQPGQRRPSISIDDASGWSPSGYVRVELQIGKEAYGTGRLSWKVKTNPRRWSMGLWSRNSCSLSCRDASTFPRQYQNEFLSSD